MLHTADYPDHPDEIVLPKNKYFNRPITEIDVFNYYSGVKNKIIPELKGKNLFIAIVPKGYKAGQKPIYVRHPYDRKTEFIRINNERDFEKYHTGRTIEFHISMPRMAPFYVIDFDAGEEPFSVTKKVTAEITDELSKLTEVKRVDIRYTGKRGFHILGWLKKARDVDSARNFLKKWLREKFGNRDDVIVGESPSGKKGAIGISPMKFNGGQVALWSLRVTGLCCVEVPRAKLMSFERTDASIDKVFEMASGKPFIFGKKKASEHAALKVASLFIQKNTDDLS